MTSIGSIKFKESLKIERLAIDIFERNFPDYVYCETPKNTYADVDAILIMGNQIMRVVETKCRDLSIEDFTQRYNCQWLVTFEKLEKGKQIARAFCVPFVGFLYLIKSNILLVQQISNDIGYVPEIIIQPTITKKNIYGGEVVRSNAFINMRNATLLK